MAAARTQQAHQKQVQKIVDEAAAKVAQSSPVEEEVTVTVDELPPDDSSSRTSSASATAERSRRAAQDTTDAWLDATRSMFDPALMTRWWDPRAMVESSFRFAAELLAVQKDFALKLADTMPVRTPS